MDPGGPTTTRLTDDPVAALARSQRVDLGGLIAARERSDELLDRLRGELSGAVDGERACVAVMGSLGRRETTSGSDLDFAVFALEPGAGRAALDATRSVMEREGAEPPRADGPFGAVVDVSDLLDHIGADADSNDNLTRRMLLLLESAPLAGDAAWRETRGLVLRRYLSKSLRGHVPPRFLLNDVIRYWRTVCVDYEGKMELRGNQGWAIRNAKLRLLRKMLYAGGLFPLLQCVRLERDAVESFLTERLERVPADRLVLAFTEHGVDESGARALQAYARFLAMLDDAETRGRLERLAEAGRDDDPLWQDVKRLAGSFQRGLDALLFETDLHGAAREYGVF